MSELNHAFMNEIEERYSDLLSDEVRADYSINQLSAIIGEKDLVSALINGRHIRKCKYCGKPFVAKRINEFYCNRKVDGKRTCKDVGPSLVRKKDPVTCELDRARRLHLWRRSAAGKDDVACRKFEEWLSFALDMESLCREGKCSFVEFRDSIGTAYTADMPDKKR